MSDCLFAIAFSINKVIFTTSAKLMLSRILLRTCTRVYSRLFPIVDLRFVLRASKQKRCRQFRHLWLVKVKVTLQSLLLHLLRSFYCVAYLALFLTKITSLSFTSNKLGNNFNWDTNLLMPMSCC